MAQSSPDGRRHRVVLLPLPYQGHINPMLRLAAALHARGLAVTILHTETRAPDRRKLPSDIGLDTIPDGVAPELAASGDIASFIFELNKNCAAPFRDYLAGALSGGAVGVACVIADVDWFRPLAAARELGVPALALMTSSAARFRVYLAYPRLCDKGYLPVQEAKMDTPIDDHSPFLVRDLHRVMTKAHHLIFSDLLARMMVGVRHSSGIVLNTFDTIEGTDIDKIQRETTLPVFAVGPLHILSPAIESSLLPQDNSCLDWLDTQSPTSVLFVSFGSLVSIDELEFLEIAWGLADSKRPFLWVVRPRLVRGRDSSELPGELLLEVSGRGRVVSWAPQHDVLRHPAVGAFLTHCGWNSTMESVSEGVPMICMPLSGDQFGTARYVCDVWKVGVRVEVGMERQTMRVVVKEAVERMMGGEEGGEFKERAKELQDTIARCTSKDGSCDFALQHLVDFIRNCK